MSIRLVLIRHGQTDHNAAGLIAGWTDSPLSLVGHAQAVRMATHVARRYRISRVYTSPLQRARTTARRLADRLGLDPVLLDDLKEVGFGALEGLSHAEVARRFPGIWESAQDPNGQEFCWPEGESAAAFAGRVRRVFSDILGQHERDTVAVVAHGGVLGAYLADLVEGNPHLWPRYVLANCSVTEVECHAGRLSVGCLGDCSFLVDDTAELARASLAGGAARRWTRVVAAEV